MEPRDSDGREPIMGIEDPEFAEILPVTEGHYQLKDTEDPDDDG